MDYLCSSNPGHSVYPKNGEVGGSGNKDILKFVLKEEIKTCCWFNRYKWQFIITNLIDMSGSCNHHCSDSKENKVLFGRVW